MTTYHAAPVCPDWQGRLMNDYRFVRCPACGSLAWKGMTACPCCGQPIPQRARRCGHTYLLDKLPPHPIIRVDVGHDAIPGPDRAPLVVPQENPAVQIPHVRES